MHPKLSSLYREFLSCNFSCEHLLREEERYDRMMGINLNLKQCKVSSLDMRLRHKLEVGSGAHFIKHGILVGIIMKNGSSKLLLIQGCHGGK